MQQLRAKTGPEMDEEERQRQAINFGKNLGWLTSGTPEQKQQAGSYFSSIANGKLTIKTDGDTYSVTGPGGTSTFSGSTQKENLQRAMIKALNLEGLPEETIIKTSLVTGAPSNTKGTVTAAKFRPNYTEQVKQYAESKANLIDESSTPATVNNYNSEFAPLGFTFSRSAEGKMVVKGPGKSKPITVYIWKKDAQNTINQYIAANQDNSITEGSGLKEIKIQRPEFKGELD